MKHSTPIPTDGDFNYEHPAPQNVLCPDSLPADKIYHIVMKEKLWRSWSGDSYGVAYLEGEKPFEVDVKGQSLSLRDKMMLRNQDGEVVAVMLHMFMEWENTYKIYGLKPYMEGQEPSKNRTHEDQPLYEWAKCKDKFMSVKKSMKTIDGVKYVMDGVGPIFGYRQMRIARDDVPAVHCKELNIGIFKGNQWEVRIGPGIDPALIVAFMAVMDEMNEDAKKGAS